MSSSDPSPLRIGILGCASIAEKNSIAILDPSSNCCVTAVASRSLEKAQGFVKSMLSSSGEEIATFGNYNDLIESNVVDALYIPLPTTLHKEWVLKALKAGKHVLLEKPVALCNEDYQEMIQAAQQNTKYLMDGTMFVHHPRTPHFVHLVQDSATMGDLKRIEAGFSFNGDEEFRKNNIRIQKTGDQLGCLGDLAWYIIRIAVLVVGPNATMSSAQVVDFQQTNEGVPIDATCLVKFDDRIVLNFQVSFTSQFRQYVHVVGTEAWASMDDFVLPKQHPVKYQVQSMDLTLHDLITEHQCRDEKFEGPVQEVLMWKNFARFSKAVDVTGSWESDSLQEARQLSQLSTNNQKILDALIDSMRKGGIKVEGTS